MCYDGEQQREGSVKRMQKWVSVWGNAVSIAENRPERYAKEITLRYPIVSPFSGSAVRLTFDNYCGTEPVTLEKVTIFCGGAFHPVTFGGERRVTLPAEGNVISDTLETPVTAGEKLLVSFYLQDFTLMRSVVFTCGALSGGLYLALRLPPMITSLGVALLLEAIAYIVAGGSESNSVVTRQPTVSDQMRQFIGSNGGSAIWLALILVTALALMIVIFHYTKFGYDYRALQSGQQIAVNTGANEYANAMGCYIIAGMLAGAAGMLFGCQIQYTRVSAYLNFGTVSKMFDAFCPLFFSGFVGRFCNKQVAIIVSVVGYEFLQLAFGNINAVDTTFTSTVYGIINSVILVLFLIYLNNENKVIELVTFKKWRAARKQAG